MNKKKTRLKELSDKFEEIMYAAAFAEAGARIGKTGMSASSGFKYSKDITITF